MIYERKSIFKMRLDQFLKKRPNIDVQCIKITDSYQINKDLSYTFLKLK